jgi:hypothetical protein
MAIAVLYRPPAMTEEQAALPFTVRGLPSTVISPKTADHHIQHIDNKIGVSTRAAAALWATEHAVVS